VGLRGIDKDTFVILDSVLKEREGVVVDSFCYHVIETPDSLNEIKDGNLLIYVPTEVDP